MDPFLAANSLHFCQIGQIKVCKDNYEIHFAIFVKILGYVHYVTVWVDIVFRNHLALFRLTVDEYFLARLLHNLHLHIGITNLHFVRGFLILAFLKDSWLLLESVIIISQQFSYRHWLITKWIYCWLQLTFSVHRNVSRIQEKRKPKRIQIMAGCQCLILFHPLWWTTHCNNYY